MQNDDYSFLNTVQKNTIETKVQKTVRMRVTLTN